MCVTAVAMHKLVLMQRTVLLTSCVHVAPFWQGCDEHALTGVEQIGSVNPGRQMHVKLFTPGTQLSNNTFVSTYCTASTERFSQKCTTTFISLHVCHYNIFVLCLLQS